MFYGFEIKKIIVILFFCSLIDVALKFSESPS